MKTWIIAFVALSSVVAFGQSETTDKVQKFSVIRLEGKLERPELKYPFEDEMTNDKDNLEIPDNFDSSIIYDLSSK